MLRFLRIACSTLFVVAPFLADAANVAATDFSERLDALWNFDQPAQSEARLRAEATQHRAWSREAVETATQLARALSLQRRFTEANKILDTIEPSLARLPARVRVRYLLERGRCENSSGRPKAAFGWFEQALVASAQDDLPGAAYYRVDTLHMLAIAAPPDEQVEWNLKALAAATDAPDERTRRWRASILNNLGWAMHAHNDYARALAYWQDALAAREAAHDVASTRIARWTVARGLRSLGRLDEAWAMQRALADELDAAHAPDGYVFEELAQIASTRGDRTAARAWATKALALLENDVELRATAPERIARLADLARGADVPVAPH